MTWPETVQIRLHHPAHHPAHHHIHHQVHCYLVVLHRHLHSHQVLVLRRYVLQLGRLTSVLQQLIKEGEEGAEHEAEAELEAEPGAGPGVVVLQAL